MRAFMHEYGDSRETGRVLDADNVEFCALEPRVSG
jgi:hypothetical protein